MIAELQEERQRIGEAIEALERLSAGKNRRRGRPPAWLSDQMDPESEETEDEGQTAVAKSKEI